MEMQFKLALPLQDLRALERQLARVAIIGRRKPERQQLYNTYYDTPTLALRHHAVALRVRRIGHAHAPQWVQTLKIAASSKSAFSCNGEWDAPITSERLDSTALSETPWSELDAGGALFQQLQPAFTTTFERLTWIVERDPGRVAVALDHGEVVFDGRSAPLCELEIELLDGSLDTVFEVASQISLQVSLLPMHMSKAERAYRLADGTLYAPLRAKPPAIDGEMDLSVIAASVLRESFGQFAANLQTVCTSDSPEVLHQARVGWRRFKGNLKLFKKAIDEEMIPSLDPLKPLLKRLTDLRDLEVAATEVLPVYAHAYKAGDAKLSGQWSHFEAALAHAIQEERATLRALLLDPAIGYTLVQLSRWHESASFDAAWRLHDHKNKDASQWATKRVGHLAEQLQALQSKSKDTLIQHRRRILAKRLRYAVESMRPLLSKKQAERWLETAMQLQSRIGAERDLIQTIAAAQRLDVAQGVVQFLRGVAFGVSQAKA